MTRRILVTLFLGAAAFGLLARADDLKGTPPAKPDETKATVEDLSIRQQRMQLLFTEFKAALLRLSQRMAASSKFEDREKAKILKMALEKANEEGVEQSFERLVRTLTETQSEDVAKITKAIDENRDLTTRIRALLTLLMSDNRDEALRREIELAQRRLEELKRIIREEENTRARTELGRAGKEQLGKEQKGITGDTEVLAKGSGKGSQGGEAKGGKPGEGKGEGKEGGDKGEGKNDTKGPKGDPKESQGGEGSKPGAGDPKNAAAGKGEGKPGSEGGMGGDKAGGSKGEGQGGGMGGGKPGEGKGDEGKKPEKPEGGKPMGQQPGQDQKDQKSDSKGREDGKGDAKPQGQQGGQQGGEQQGGSKGGEGGQQAGGSKGGGQQGGQQGGGQQGGGQQGGEQGDQEQDFPGRKRVQDAIEDMKRAQEEIAKGKNDAASKDQGEAIKKLKEAQKKLEDLLRQLREEEVERILAALQMRCERMLAMQIEVRDGTVTLDKVVKGRPDAKPDVADIQKSLDLEGKEQNIIKEAADAERLIRSEGSAVAFPVVLEEVIENMIVVARRLRQTDTGPVTVTYENQIIDTLREMIEALKKARQENGKKPPPPGGGGGGGGGQQNQPLIDELAELKMIRNMQARVYKLTQAYGNEFEGEQAPAPRDAKTPDEQKKAQILHSELQNLSDRQDKIQQVTKDLYRGKNK